MPESREYPSRPFVGVGVVVLKEDNVLLIRRGRPPRLGEWSLPGGAQSVGETVQVTAFREVLEETGVSIQNPQFLEVVDSIIKDDDGRVKFHYTQIDNWANWESGTQRVLRRAARRVGSLHKLKLGLWTKTLEVLKSSIIRNQSAMC